MSEVRRRRMSTIFAVKPGRIWVLLLASLMVCPVVLAQDRSNQVTDIRVDGDASEVSILISTLFRPDSSVHALSSPSRLVVDIVGSTASALARTRSVDKGPVSSLVVREFTDAGTTISRITIQLDGVVDYSSDILDKGIRVTIRPKAGDSADYDGGSVDPLGAELQRLSSEPEERVENVTLGGQARVRSEVPGSPAAPVVDVSGPPELTGLDFLPYEKVSRVRLRSNHPIRYTISPVTSDNQVIVEVADVRLADRIRLPLDTSEFPSAVKMISPYTMKGTRKGVRIAIKLREPVDYTLDEQGTQLFIDFPVPASILASLPANPVGDYAAGSAGAAGVQPDEAVSESDTTGQIQHTQITHTGQVVDPAAQQPRASGGFDLAFGSDSSGPYTGRKISIDVRNADIHNVFRMISNVSNLNIVAGDNVKGKVTLRLQDVPWDQALAVVLQAKSLGAVRFGNIIRIAPLSQLKSEREERLNAEKANLNLEPLQTLVVPLNYAVANDVSKQVQGALTERGKLTIDKRTNSLIIEDTSAGLARARQLAITLDRPTPQVLIEARIVEVSSTYVKELGIQWGGNLDATADGTGATGLYFPSGVQVGGGLSDTGTIVRAGDDTDNWVVDLPSAGSAGSLSLSLGSIANAINVDARLTAIESMGKGKVISAPKVLTVDNKQAQVTQGTRIPYETISAAGTSVQFIEATLKLSVTPHITQDERVFLQVKVSNNRPDFGNAVNGRPAIEIKETTTEVMVRSGDTAVLGGVYTVNETENTTGLPALQRIPVLGWLFKSKATRTDRKELLVFITPHLVSRKAS